MLTRRTLLTVLAAAPLAAKEYAVHKPKVEVLWKSPDGHPNALEATDEGLWVGEETTDIAYLLDWNSGKVLQKVSTESSNTSGMAFGGGYLWMAANGGAIGRDPRPTDTTRGEVVKIDAKTETTFARYPMPGDGGVHGLCWHQDSLWITTLHQKTLTETDVDFNVKHSIPVTLTRAHGLAGDGDSIWCMFSNDYRVLRMSKKDGRILEAIQLTKGVDPDPHGMTLHQGAFYYCDSGIAGRGVSNDSKYAGYIARVTI